MNVHFMQKLGTLIFVTTAFAILAINSNHAVGQNLMGDDLFLDGGATNQPDIFFDEVNHRHSICMRKDFFRFLLENDGETATNKVFELNNDAPQDAAGVFANGFGIGTVAPTNSFHVFAGDGSPYPDAKVFVQNTSSTVNLRELLRLQNNGGVGMIMLDTAASKFFRMENVSSNFELSSGPVHFRASDTSSNNSLNLGTVGVGIGIASPTSTLHIRADNNDMVESKFGTSTITTETKGGVAQARVLLNCINNGPTILSMTDTNRPAFSQWLITNTVFGSIDALSLRKNGPGAPNFTIFEDGNIRFTFNGIPNCTIQPNGNLFVRGIVQSSSDRNLKENFKPVDPEAILAKVVEMPITTWNFNFDEDDVPHMGPMAQDFYRSFGLGDSDTTIAEVDKDGVALAAIQGLNKKMEAKNETISKLNEDLIKQSEVIANQSELIAALTERLDRLESVVSPTQR